MKKILKVLLIIACLPATSALASGTCSIRETADVQGSHSQDSGRTVIRTQKDVRDLNECVEAGKELLGKTTVDRFTFIRKVGPMKTGQRTRHYNDSNATLMTVKVVLKYQDDEIDSHPVVIKFKYR